MKPEQGANPKGANYRRIVAALAVVVILGFASIEIALQLSYRAIALADYSSAISYSEKAKRLAEVLYPVSSGRYRDVFLSDLSLRSRFAIAGNHTGGSERGTVADVLRFAKFHESSLSRVEMARIYLEGGRIANQLPEANGGALVGYGILRSKYFDEIRSDNQLLAEAEDEQAYSELVGLVATLSSKNGAISALNAQLAADNTEAHNKAQSVVCQSNVVRCRVNHLRWKIGQCIRSSYIKDASNCQKKVFLEVTNLTPTGVCDGIDLNDCFAIAEEIQPYYIQLLRTLGR